MPKLSSIIDDVKRRLHGRTPAEVVSLTLKTVRHTAGGISPAAARARRADQAFDRRCRIGLRLVSDFHSAGCERIDGCRIDDLRARQLVFDVGDAPLDERLLLLRGLVFGVLADVAPTVLTLMGVPVPPEMTGKSLVELKA